MKKKFQDFPLKEIREAVAAHVKEGRTIHQKFTCSGCGKRLTISEPNTLYREGECEDCGTVTDLEVTGCNYLMMARVYSDEKRGRKQS